jgi:enamine deaminase RidA (YjgF/YER057c/UK114 family)
MPTTTTERLAERGIDLPPAPASVGAFVQTVRSDRLGFTSGHIAVNGEHGLLATGVVGSEVDLPTATACARQCALNVVAQLQDGFGSLDNIRRVLKLTVFVASAPGFSQQHLVANGASEVIAEVFGENGGHCRSAIGVAILPFNSPVEVEAVVELTD